MFYVIMYWKHIVRYWIYRGLQFINYFEYQNKTGYEVLKTVKDYGDDFSRTFLLWYSHESFGGQGLEFDSLNEKCIPPTHSLLCLNTQFPVGDAAGEALESIESGALLEEVCYRRQALPL